MRPPFFTSLVPTLVRLKNSSQKDLKISLAVGANEVKEGGSTSASQANWGRGGPAGKNTSHGGQKKQHPMKIEML